MIQFITNLSSQNLTADSETYIILFGLTYDNFSTSYKPLKVRRTLLLSKLSITVCIHLFLSSCSPLHNSGIMDYLGMGPVRLSVFAHSSNGGYIDFLLIWYRDQVPWSANACKVEFVSMPNLSNYSHFS